jgi:hypothetical protein
LDKLVLLSETIDSLLAKATADVEDPCIGPCFLRFAPALRVYSPYFRNYDRAIKLINRLNKMPEFAEFVKRQSEASGGIWLESYLFTPIQQLPRYELLLRDLLKVTWTDHPDYEPLSVAMEAIHATVTVINMRTKAVEAHGLVVKVQSLLSNAPQLVEEDRLYVHEGFWVSAKSKNKLRTWGRDVRIYVFLFNDCFVKAKLKSSKRPTPVGLLDSGDPLEQSFQFVSLTKFESLSWRLVNVELATAHKVASMQAIAYRRKDTPDEAEMVWILGQSPTENSMWIQKLAEIKAKAEEEAKQSKAKANSMKKATRSLGVTRMGMVALEELVQEADKTTSS